MASNRRAQARKTRVAKVVKSGNPEYVQGMQDLRRSNATAPVPSGRVYRRKAKNQRVAELDN